MTRVAGANTDMWTDIYRANRGAIAEEIARVPEQLEHVEELLRRRRRGAWNDRARETGARCSRPAPAAGPCTSCA